MINYAHRGASEYAPENTLSSFYLGLMQGANGIETDVQRTRDGALVLFHDETLDRVTDAKGPLAEYTLEELKEVKVYGNAPNGFYDRIITLKEFLEKFATYDIRFAIELKGAGVEEESLALIKEHGALARTTFTSFHFDYIKKIKDLDSTARVGWLTWNPEEAEIQQLRSIGGEEMAPDAKGITKEMMANLRNNGLGVRAWGVVNTALMRKACKMGVDGMTVNFPDKLFRYLGGK
ncbi:MAG: hypothetical protein J6D04_01320 [Clostridia bacterium]|nr:hypothetical protein [Clostridia bacterium]